MKIYLAANYEDHEKMEREKAKRENMGHEVVSTWHDPERVSEAVQMEDILSPKKFQKYLAGIAELDLAEIDECDKLILDNSNVSKTGGKHVEYGYALARGKQVAITGDIKNVFHYWGV